MDPLSSCLSLVRLTNVCLRTSASVCCCGTESNRIGSNGCQVSSGVSKVPVRGPQRHSDESSVLCTDLATLACPYLGLGPRGSACNFPDASTLVDTPSAAVIGQTTTGSQPVRFRGLSQCSLQTLPALQKLPPKRACYWCNCEIALPIKSFAPITCVIPRQSWAHQCNHATHNLIWKM